MLPFWHHSLGWFFQINLCTISLLRYSHPCSWSHSLLGQLFLVRIQLNWLFFSSASQISLNLWTCEHPRRKWGHIKMFTEGQGSSRAHLLSAGRLSFCLPMSYPLPLHYLCLLLTSSLLTHTHVSVSNVIEAIWHRHMWQTNYAFSLHRTVSSWPIIYGPEPKEPRHLAPCLPDLPPQDPSILFSLLSIVKLHSPPGPGIPSLPVTISLQHKYTSMWTMAWGRNLSVLYFIISFYLHAFLEC